MQQSVDLMDGGTGSSRCFCLGVSFCVFAFDILAARRLAQSAVQVLQVIRLELLHLHVSDIGNNKVLDGGQIGLISLGCPLMLAALFGSQSIRNSPTVTVEGIRKVPLASSCSTCFLRFIASSLVEKLSHLSQLLPVLVLVGVADAIRAASFCDICHNCLLVRLPGTARRENCPWGRGCFRLPVRHGTRWCCCTGYRQSAG